MTDLERMINGGLPVMWGTIWVGWQGPSRHPSVISTEEVISYATNQLVQCETDCSRDLVDLASTDTTDIRNVERVLWHVVSNESSNADTEILKWEIVLLRELLQELSSDPVDALMELTHFWSLFDYPADNPHTIQGMGNDITPEEYYTKVNLRYIFDKHLEWLKQRESELIV